MEIIVAVVDDDEARRLILRRITLEVMFGGEVDIVGKSNHDDIGRTIQVVNLMLELPFIGFFAQEPGMDGS